MRPNMSKIIAKAFCAGRGCVESMYQVQPKKSLHGPTGACHGPCRAGNGHASRAVAREFKR
jgi:hypothetical protein